MKETSTYNLSDGDNPKVWVSKWEEIVQWPRLAFLSKTLSYRGCSSFDRNNCIFAQTMVLLGVLSPSHIHHHHNDVQRCEKKNRGKEEIKTIRWMVWCRKTIRRTESILNHRHMQPYCSHVYNLQIKRSHVQCILRQWLRAEIWMMSCHAYPMYQS